MTYSEPTLCIWRSRHAAWLPGTCSPHSVLHPTCGSVLVRRPGAQAAVQGRAGAGPPVLGCRRLRASPGCSHPPAPSIHVGAPGLWCPSTWLRLVCDFELPTSGPCYHLTTHLTDLLLSLPSLSRATCGLHHFSPSSLVCLLLLPGHFQQATRQPLCNLKGIKARKGLSRHLSALWLTRVPKGDV